MRNRWQLLIGLLASGYVCVAQTPPQPGLYAGPSVAQERHEKVRQFLASIAADLPVFETYAFTVNKWPMSLPRGPIGPPIDEQYRRAMAKLIQAKFDDYLLIPLLEDPQPRIRTLAMALLFQKEDPWLLNELVPLLRDDTDTFPTAAPEASGLRLVSQPQTVGMVAQSMLNAYLSEAGLHCAGGYARPVLEIPGSDVADYTRRQAPVVERDWQAFQETHPRGRTYLSWLCVRVMRASGNMLPTEPLVARFREDLNRLPPRDRDLYLLWLSGRDRFPLAPETDLVGLAERLGHQTLLQIVSGWPPSRDPDLLATYSPARFRAVVSFILSNADKLLKPEDAIFLTVIEQGERDRISKGCPELLPLSDYGRARALLLRASRH